MRFLLAGCALPRSAAAVHREDIFLRYNKNK